MKLVSGQLKWLASLVMPVVVTILVGGCALFNQLPVISSLIASEEWVALAGVCQVECIASDPDDDSLSYIWSADGGNISEEESEVTWVAPNAYGNYTITVTVTDGRGGEDSKSITIQVCSCPGAH